MIRHRRDLLKHGLALAGGALALGAALPALSLPEVPASGVRRLRLANLHTGESLDAAYWEQGAYLPDALAEVNQVLRDFRTGEVHVIEPRLLDLLVSLHGQVGATSGFQVISGYRSPATNAALHRESGQVAAHSLHMEGKAIDIRVPGVQLAHLHAAAVGLGAGGVGYYPASDFVHMDVGRVRQWGGT